MGDETFNEHYAEDFDKRWKLLQGRQDVKAKQRARSFYLRDTQAYRDVVAAINAALYLRRPLLITGNPGSGKTSLAYAVADRLGLGPVLEWSIQPRSTLREALSVYEPLARLQDVQRGDTRPVGDYITLGPLGTAFLPGRWPRVLLIDEIDKCDISLPNELLNLFEEGSFPIPELVREASGRGALHQATPPAATPEQPPPAATEVATCESPIPAQVREGRVRCKEFRLIVMTSNGERDFPPAFHRRCIRISMPDPTKDEEMLKKIVTHHLCGGDLLGREDFSEEESSMLERVKVAIDAFASEVRTARSQRDYLSVDQLLNLAFLLERGVSPPPENGTSTPDQDFEQLRRVLLQALNATS